MNASPTTPTQPAQKTWRTPSLSRLLVFFFASVLTLLALAWAIENWRGASAWSAARRDLMARGEPLSMDQLVPPLPPASENFAATPLLRGILDYAPQSGNQGSLWLNPETQARLNAISLPPARVPSSRRGAQTRHESDRRSESDARMDLEAYALGVHLMPRNCPPNLSPALAERYGYLPPGVKWTKPTNELDIAASIVDPAQEVLTYLQRFQPELDEIAEAVRRPHSQFAVHWTEGFQALLPHLAPLKQFGILFSVRAAARLQKQDAAGAFADTLTCLRLAQAEQSEPLLISQLVRFALHSFAVKTVWEGLVAQQWNEEQLAAIQNQLAQFDFQQAIIRALRGERILQNQFLDRFSQFRGTSIDAAPTGEIDTSSVVTLCGWVPGWTRQNQVRLNRYDDMQLRQVLAPGWPATLTHTPEDTALLGSAGLEKNTVYSVLAHVLAPNFTKGQVKAARAQTINRLAMVACALERYRLEHGAYPKDLSELAPRYLTAPVQDPMSAAPFRYEFKAEPGLSAPLTFKLWSVGLNGRDDGGVMFEKGNDARSDWVWPQPVEQSAPRLF